MLTSSEKRERLRRLRSLRKQKEKRKGLTNLYHFNKVILDNWVQERVHHELCDIVSDRSNQRQLILAPRDHHKSTCLTCAYATQRIIDNTNTRVIIANATAKNAKNFLRRIKANLKKRKVVELYGRFDQLADSWNETTIILERTGALAEPTVEAVGVGGDIVSEHAELLILDDLVNLKNVRTHPQRQKVIEWMIATFDIVTKDGQIIILGTRYDPNEVYGFILKNKDQFPDNVWKKIVRCAVLPDGTPWFSDKFTVKDLEKKKLEKGYVMFLAQYQNDVTGLEDRIFKSHWIQTFKEAPLGITMTVGGMDLAATSLKRMKQRERETRKKQNPDYTAFVTVGITEDKHIWVINRWRGRLSYKEQKERVKEEYRTFAHNKIGIESNQYQYVMSEDLIDTTVIPVVPITSTESKEARARRTSLFFEQGRVHIHESMKDLIEELIFFPDKKKDLVDALGKAIEVVEHKSKAIFFGEA